MLSQIPNSEETILAVFVEENSGLKTVLFGWVGLNGTLSNELKTEKQSTPSFQGTPQEGNSQQLDSLFNKKLQGNLTQLSSTTISIEINSKIVLHEIQKFIIGFKGKIIFQDAKKVAHELELFGELPANPFDISLGLELGNFKVGIQPVVHSVVSQHPSRGESAGVDPLPLLEVDTKLARESTPNGSDGNTQNHDLLNNILGQYFFLQENLSEQVKDLWVNIESKLALVLAKIEHDGVYINKAALEDIAKQLTLKTNQLQHEILGKIGETNLNLNSPAQLGVALKNLGYPLKETKTGKISTDRAVLEELLLTDTNSLIQPILDYRTVAKLSSTYTQTFLSVLDENSRVHTVYNQLGSATGRISSTSPNLQNIPIRNPEYGPLIRSCFSAETGNTLVCADYSQIELRLLAHFSGDEVLTEAFALNQDIHQRTASEIFEIPLEKVTKQQRRLGKTLNFALVYQQGSFATAVQLGVTQKEAAEFIKKYFDRFSKVKPFIDETINLAKQRGFVETLMGRRRYFQNLNSSMVMLRKIDERAAFNAVLQGSNADLIKKAMIELNQTFQLSSNFESLTNSQKPKMVLQVHDELVVECGKEVSQKVSKIVEETMELNQPLKVPILVEAGIGENWRDGKM